MEPKPLVYLAGLIFLQYYIECYTPARFTPSPLQCFCNNLGVITNVTALLSMPTLHPNNTTNDNCDHYKAITKMLLKCSPLQSQLLPVKGHQDKDPKHQLTIPEQLNVDCDHQAKQYAQSTTKSNTALNNPAIPMAQSHLQIAPKIICGNVVWNLHCATSAPNIISTLNSNSNGPSKTLTMFTGRSSTQPSISFYQRTNNTLLSLSMTNPHFMPCQSTHTMDPHSVLPANASMKMLDISMNAWTQQEKHYSKLSSVHWHK